MTGFGTPVEVALTGAAIAMFADCCAAGAAGVLAVSFGVTSPLYIPAAICACVCAWTRAWAVETNERFFQKQMQEPTKLIDQINTNNDA